MPSLQPVTASHIKQSESGSLRQQTLLSVPTLDVVSLPASTSAQNSISGNNRKKRLGKILEDVNSLKSERNLIALVGDSITAAGMTSKSNFAGYKVLNMGVSGDRTDQVSDRVFSYLNLFEHAPKAIVLLAGVNDLRQRKPQQNILENIERTVKAINNRFPQTKVIILSILPTRLPDLNRRNIPSINKDLERVVKPHNAIFVDAFKSFADTKDVMKREFTTNGIHLSKEGYKHLYKILQENINSGTDVGGKAALVP